MSERKRVVARIPRVDKERMTEACRESQVSQSRFIEESIRCKTEEVLARRQDDERRQ